MKKKGKTLAVDSSSDSDSDDLIAPSPLTQGSSDQQWKREFNHYLKGEDELPEGMTLVQWWGVCLSFTYFEKGN